MSCWYSHPCTFLQIILRCVSCILLYKVTTKPMLLINNDRNIKSMCACICIICNKKILILVIAYLSCIPSAKNNFESFIKICKEWNLTNCSLHKCVKVYRLCIDIKIFKFIYNNYIKTQKIWNCRVEHIVIYSL